MGVAALSPGPVTVLCLPYAGGSAAIYHRWRRTAPADLSIRGIELPGRGALHHESPYYSMGPLVRHLCESILPHTDGRYVLFGHSMGGLLAYEIVRLLRQRSVRLPEHLYVSATAPPGSRSLRRSLHNASDEEVIEELRDLGGTPPELFDEPDLMHMAARTLRADYSVLWSYTAPSGDALQTPLTVFGGKSDHVVPPTQLRGWRTHAGSEYRLKVFPGDHFFLHSAQTQIMRIIGEAAALPAGVTS